MRALIKTFRKRQAAKRAAKGEVSAGVPLARTQSRAASINQSLYSNRTTFLSRATRRFGLGKKVHIEKGQLQRFSSIQAANTGATLARSTSRPQ